MSQPDSDVIIIGAGPTGLAAAVYTGREGLRTTVLESDIVGGMIATTEIVDNLPGFPDGIGGIELSDQLLKHAKRFGAEVLTNHRVQAITRSSRFIAVETNKGVETARAVLIASGARYRHMEVAGEDALIGHGVHYCATCDGPLYRGKDLVVVGGGNTALQEGLFLTRFAKKLTFVVRGPKFKGSQVLIDKLMAQPNVTVLFDTEVVQVKAKQNVFNSADVRYKATGTTTALVADGLFAFVGLIPNTTFLTTSADLDTRGFIIANPQFETTVLGVFAAGDVCKGATGQLATAMGDGVAAAIKIGHFLNA